MVQPPPAPYPEKESLQLRRKKRPDLVLKASVEDGAAPDITVVITNFRRSDKVSEAFESCVRARVRNIVVSSSGCDADLARVHEGFKRRAGVIVDSIREDRGCNEMWLRGVRLAKTPWVHILHDDDLLLPDFYKLQSHLKENVGFFHWDGAKHADPPSILGGDVSPYRTFRDRPSGVYSTDAFWPILLNEHSNSLSPVSGLFRKEHLVEVLEECEKELIGPEFAYSPTMMVGNDLMIWLRAVEKYPTFRYFTTPLISYGHWAGSCSYHESQLGFSSIRKIYNSTRDYFLTGGKLEKTGPTFARVYSDFVSKPEDAERYSHPVALWDAQYETKRWIHLPVPTSSLPRCFKDSTGRTVPYVKDLVDYTFSKTTGDVCVLMNMDILPSPSITNQLSRGMRSHSAAFSFRRDVPQFKVLDDKQIRTQTHVYSGVDLFAISRDWWSKNSDSYPDMLYATEAWDFILRLLMEDTDAKRFLYLIYHVTHTPEGTRNYGSTSQQYNRRLCEPWLANRGIAPYWIKHTNLNPR